MRVACSPGRDNGSFPLELSLLAATKPEMLRALARNHAEELARHYNCGTKKSGEADCMRRQRACHLQRWMGRRRGGCGTRIDDPT